LRHIQQCFSSHCLHGQVQRFPPRALRHKRADFLKRASTGLSVHMFVDAVIFWLCLTVTISVPIRMIGSWVHRTVHSHVLPHCLSSRGVHEETHKSWTAPFSARSHFTASSTFTTLNGPFAGQPVSNVTAVSCLPEWIVCVGLYSFVFNLYFLSFPAVYIV